MECANCNQFYLLILFLLLFLLRFTVHVMAHGTETEYTTDEWKLGGKCNKLLREKNSIFSHEVNCSATAATKLMSEREIDKYSVVWIPKNLYVRQQRSGNCCVPCWSLHKYWIRLGRAGRIVCCAHWMTEWLNSAVRGTQTTGRSVCNSRKGIFNVQPHIMLPLVHSKSIIYPYLCVHIFRSSQGENNGWFSVLIIIIAPPSTPSAIIASTCVYVCVFVIRGDSRFERSFAKRYESLSRARKITHILCSTAVIWRKTFFAKFMIA